MFNPKDALEGLTDVKGITSNIVAAAFWAILTLVAVQVYRYSKRFRDLNRQWHQRADRVIDVTTKNIQLTTATPLAPAVIQLALLEAQHWRRDAKDAAAIAKAMLIVAGLSLVVPGPPAWIKIPTCLFFMALFALMEWASQRSEKRAKRTEMAIAEGIVRAIEGGGFTPSKPKPVE